MTLVHTAAQQIPITLQQITVFFKLTKETSQKKLILDSSDSSDINQEYLEDNIPPTTTETKNGVDSFQGDNPEQEPIRIEILTLKTAIDLALSRTQTITQINNIKKEMVGLLFTAEFIASRNWDKVPLAKGDWEGSNDHDDKSLGYCLKG